MVDETDTRDRRNGTAEGFSKLVEIAGKVIAPVSVITALMVYFGWSFTSAAYRTFGIDDTVLGFTIQDYLFRSINETFRPAVLLLLVIMLAIPAHLGLTKAMRERRWRKQTIVPLVTTGVALIIIGLLGFLKVVIYRVVWPLVPLSLGVGVLFIGYATSLWRATIGTKIRPLGNSDMIDLIARFAFAAFVVVTLFWSVARYAQIHGVEYALLLAQHSESLPGVVIFAPHPLHLDGWGIRESVLIGDQGSHYYRYDGLRLLVRANDRYILLPLHWQPGGRTIVLHDDPNLRLEFYLGDD